jgi:hypothetical protein
MSTTSDPLTGSPFAPLSDAEPLGDPPFAPLTDGPQADLEPEPPAEEVIELDATGRAYYAELRDALAARAGLDELIEYAKGQIQKAMGDASEATIDGRPVATYRKHTRKNFVAREAKRFLTDEQIAACTQESEVRTFRTVDG